MSRSILDTTDLTDPVGYVQRGRLVVVSGVPFESIWVVDQSPNLWMSKPSEPFGFSRLRMHLNSFQSMDSPEIFFHDSAVVNDWKKKVASQVQNIAHGGWALLGPRLESRILAGAVWCWTGLVCWGKPSPETMGLATPVKGFAAFFLKYGGWLGSLGFVG